MLRLSQQIDGDTAKGSWYLLDISASGGETANPIILLGLYHETYRRDDGVWRIASLALRYLRHECATGAGYEPTEFEWSFDDYMLDGVDNNQAPDSVFVEFLRAAQIELPLQLAL